GGADAPATAGGTPALRYVDVFLALRRNIIHGGRALQFVPCKLAAFQGALQCLEQHDRKQLAISEALQPHLAQQPHIFLPPEWARSRAKAIAEAIKSMTRNAKKNSTSLWKSAGSVESGWKCFWM